MNRKNKERVSLTRSRLLLRFDCQLELRGLMVDELKNTDSETVNPHINGIENSTAPSIEQSTDSEKLMFVF